MAFDSDPQSVTQWLLAVLGLGGGGYKIVTHESRIAKLETDRDSQATKLDKIGDTTSRLDERTTAIKEDVSTILAEMRERHK